jgi:hypothetical protein
MASRDNEWIKRELVGLSPGVMIPNPLDYLVDEEGHVYRWPPGWGKMGVDGSGKACRSRGASPWKGFSGDALERDNRSVAVPGPSSDE